MANTSPISKDIFQHSWKTYKNENTELEKVNFLSTETPIPPTHIWDKICEKLDEMDGINHAPAITEKFVPDNIIKAILLAGSLVSAALIIWSVL